MGIETVGYVAFGFLVLLFIGMKIFLFKD